MDQAPRTSSPYRDTFGLTAPVPADLGLRAIPQGGFPTGPAVGERLPELTLRAATGERVDFHAHRDGAKAAVVFLRSAVW